MRKIAIGVLALLLLGGAFAAAQQKGKAVTISVPPLPPSTEDLLVVDPQSAAWFAGEKAGLPKGAQLALIGQDPVSTGLTMYLKAPTGWRMPAHWHTHTEYAALLAGKATLTIDGKPHALAPGSYVVLPGKTRHELVCDAGECLVLQRRSGPLDINWVAAPK
jgi:quercetin dioxygenase-like cupin family protein